MKKLLKRWFKRLSVKTKRWFRNNPLNQKRELTKNETFDIDDLEDWSLVEKLVSSKIERLV